ncbi:helix-turn-helix domain-containing protein [Streptacidiphilus sp. 4-A2]|nr:helix-turn-helix domain-containing protein [Streptacidiphilus sp. 4-A2]
MGSTWKPLPEELSDAGRKLAEELRSIKDSSGLSLSAMAAATHYSKASWERWLNGKRLITTEGVRALAACTDSDPAGLLALLDEATEGTARPARKDVVIAATEEASRPEPAPLGDAGGQPPARTAGAWVRGWRAGLLGAVAGMAVMAAVLWLTSGNGAGAGSQPTAGKVALPPPSCQGIGCVGKDPQSTGCEEGPHAHHSPDRYGHHLSALQPPLPGCLERHHQRRPAGHRDHHQQRGDQQTALIHWGYDNYSMMVGADSSGTTLKVCGHQPDGNGCTGAVTDLARYSGP